MVLVTVVDASVPAREEQEAVGESSMASGDLAASLPTQGTMRGPLLLLCNFESISQHLLQGGPLLAVTE